MEEKHEIGAREEKHEIRARDGRTIGTIGRDPEGWWWQRASDGLNSGASLPGAAEAEEGLRRADLG